MQTSAGEAITDIDKISAVIEDMGRLVAGIAAGIEEQAAVTKDVAGNVAQASSGVHSVTERVSQTANVSQDIARDVASVHAALREVQQGGAQVQERAADLSKLAKQLEARVSTFKIA